MDVKAGELPSEEMYMAGKALFPLTTAMAARIAGEFDGKLRLSYAGGADFFNIDKLFQCGIWPITMATTELKPGGYQRFKQIGDKLVPWTSSPLRQWTVNAVEAPGHLRRSDRYHVKAVKPLPRRKLYEKVPLLDCFTAPARAAVPSARTFPSISSCAARAATPSALPHYREKSAALHHRHHLRPPLSDQVYPEFL